MTNNNTFEPENELEAELIRATRDPVYRIEFYKIFLESEVFVFINKRLPNKENMYIVTEEKEIEFIAKMINGKACLPIFSSLKRLDDYLGERKMTYIRINTKELLESIDPKLTIILNLGSSYGKEFTPLEIKHLLDDIILE